MKQLLICLILSSTVSCAVEPENHDNTKPTFIEQQTVYEPEDDTKPTFIERQTVYESEHVIGGVNLKAVEDFNNDGKDDILITHQEGYKSYTLLRSEEEGFEEELIEDNRAFVRNVSIADYDNDGDLDVYAFIHDGNGENILLRNFGKYLKVEYVPTNTGSQFSHGGAHGDINNDGLIDIFVGNGNVNGVIGVPYFLINDGAGNFTVNESLFNYDLAESNSIMDAKIHDYDFDGDLDILLLLGESQGVRFAWNDGKGNFTIKNSTQYLPDWIVDDPKIIDSINASAVNHFDYDSDGDEDIFVTYSVTHYSGGWQSAHIQVLQNNRGTFKVITKDILPIQFHIEDTKYDVGFPLGLDFGDIDNDGLMDIVLTTNSQNQWIEDGPYPQYPYIFFQQNDNTFIPATKNGFKMFGKTFYLRVGDFNGDGKDDISGVEYINKGGNTYKSKVRIFLNDA